MGVAPVSRDDDGQLHLATLTRLWLFPKYLYRIGDKALGNPINLRAVAWGLLLVPTFWLASSLLPGGVVGWSGLGLVPRLVLPILCIFFILTKIAHGAKPWEVAWSWLRMAWHLRRRPKPHLPIALRSCIRNPVPPCTHH